MTNENNALKGFAINKISSVITQIKGVIDWENIKSKFDETYRELSKNISLKGFRRGKVPRSILDKMFRKHVEKDVIHELIREKTVDFLKEHAEVKPSQEPYEWKIDADKVENNKDLEFSVEIEIIPEVEVKEFEGFELTKYKVPVKDEEIEKKIEEYRSKHVEIQDFAEGDTIAEGCDVSFSIMGKIEDEPVSVEKRSIKIPEGKPEDKFLFEEYILRQYVGKKIESLPMEEEIELTFNDEVEEKYAGKSGKFFVEIFAVSKNTLPEINDDLAKTLDMGDNLDEMKSKIKEELEKEKENTAEYMLQNQIADLLLEKNDFEVGDSLVRRQAEMQVDQLFGSFGGQIDASMKQQFIDNYMDISRKEVKKSLLLEALAKRQNIETSDEDLNKRLEEIAERNHENVERIKARYEKTGELETLKSIIRLDKVIELIKEKAKITEKEVDEFPKQEHEHGNEHDHDHE